MNAFREARLTAMVDELIRLSNEIVTQRDAARLQVEKLKHKVARLNKEVDGVYERNRYLLERNSRDPVTTCEEEHFQNCSVCWKVTCCDNTNKRMKNLVDGIVESKTSELKKCIRKAYEAHTFDDDIDWIRWVDEAAALLGLYGK